MNKKDYKLIASVIKSRLNFNEKIEQSDFVDGCLDELFFIATELADALKVDNQLFDRSKFLTACGVIDGNKQNSG